MSLQTQTTNAETAEDGNFMQVNSLSDILQLILIPIKSVLFHHKKKVLFFTVTTFLMLVVLFPYSDLSFFAQNKINGLIRNTGSHVSFSDLNFSFLPIGMKTKELNLSLQGKNPIKVDEFTVSPSFFSLLKLQPGGSLQAEGIFGGMIDLSVGFSGTNDEDQKEFDLDLDISRIALVQIFNFLDFPVKLNGLAKGNLNAEGEESFRKQPEGDFNFGFKDVMVPQELNTPVGPISLPKKIKWSNSILKGNFENGRIVIENGTLGTKSSPVNGRYKGQLDCPVTRSPAGLKTACKRYDIKVELELDRDFETKLAKNFSLMINPKEINKQLTPNGGARYLFTVSGGAFKRPSLKSLKSF